MNVKQGMNKSWKKNLESKTKPSLNFEWKLDNQQYFN
jgi:hypothetical protein